MVEQSTTPYQLQRNPDKVALCTQFVGTPLDSLRTPALIIDRNVFAENCAKMHKRANDWGATFRAHLKTHKTAEGTKLQLISSEATTSAVIVSTMMEAWELVQSGLVADSTVKDILYGLPVAVNKIKDLSALWETIAPYGGIVRLLVDHPGQIQALEEYESHQRGERRWSVFVKINGGQNRAGVLPGSQEFMSLLEVILNSPAISLHGFYGHAGNSYASTSLSEASRFLSSEVEVVNIAAQTALGLLPQSRFASVHTQPFILSVGATPTAHAASIKVAKGLYGNLELHAGNYPMLDLQQQHTTLIGNKQVSQRVRASVVSYYPGRGGAGRDEALVDAGAIAFSKDSGPSGSYGEVIGKPWVLQRISQEHGILIHTGDEKTDKLELGTKVDIICQHACLTAAAYPWYYIVDCDVEEGRKVVDVWVPWKGW